MSEPPSEQRIVFGGDAGLYFDAALSALCERETAVTLTFANGTSQGAVLRSLVADVLTIEHWDDQRDCPSGKLAVVGCEGITEVRVH
ncbi:MAG: hypothetical protein ACYCU7_16185 [Acidimicrobiales bacterium]